MSETARPDPMHPTPRQWARAVARTRERLLTMRPHAFARGEKVTCPECGAKQLEGVHDLVRETTAGSIALVHHNLHGARCQKCGTEYLESFEEMALEEAGAQHILHDYLAKVTKVSGRNLGTYWPRDVVRVMDLHNQDELHVQVLDEDTMVVRRRHPQESR